ncbi:unnamed protein product [Citrullus colocynthis]|uniref:Uncharacterized protein n=1 Tax=Citrullus colocynthis TaxID=252529 RepID=A0ABP0Y1T1_9ROSI
MIIYQCQYCPLTWHDCNGKAIRFEQTGWIIFGLSFKMNESIFEEGLSFILVVETYSYSKRVALYCILELCIFVCINGVLFAPKFFRTRVPNQKVRRDIPLMNCVFLCESMEHWSVGVDFD